MKPMTLGEAARRAGVLPVTAFYWRRLGLLKTPGGRVAHEQGRPYDCTEETVRRLCRIRERRAVQRKVAELMREGLIE